MTIDINGTTVEVLGKSYQLKCQQEDIPGIQKAAEYLEEKMREIRKSNNIISIDRLAVVAALNIAHELLALERENYIKSHEMTQRLRDLQTKIDGALIKDAQMELSAPE